MDRIPLSWPKASVGGDIDGGIMFYVYILRSDKNQKLYNGYTTDLKRRLAEHNSGLSFATKPYIPWQLEFYAGFKSELLAKNFEKYLKSGSGWAFAKKRFVQNHQK